MRGFGAFSQVVAVAVFNLRNIPRRLGSSLTAVVGIAGVVAVMVGVLSIAEGIMRTMERSAAPNNVIVLRSGATTEMMSGFGGDSVRLINEAPGIARTEQGLLSSPELFVIINLPKKSTGTDANVPLRGVTPTAFAVRDRFSMVEGRRFRPGLNEVIVGVGAADEFAGLDVGSSVTVSREQWPVVGIFEAGGGLAESEIWVDAAVLQQAYRRGNSYQSVVARLDSGSEFQDFKDALTTNPQLNVKPMREADYYIAQSSTLYRVITGIGTAIAIVMGLGAVFGALNTMYTAVSERRQEIATLRALGFSSGPVVCSVLLESLVLALIGGAIGALLAWLAFDGFRAATMNWGSFSQVTFAFDVNFPLLVRGITFATVIGLIGGLFPAIHAARQPIANALRAL
ncbi:ABC transporter permease [Elongatibacter sediminis]|uniref:FtsX-like permease family protein n=1 Tax=Elongatibacter sediminis TaxID=3119006 RepID=A0AAW9R6F7_9GAMM